MIRDIVQYGHPVLRQKCRPVTEVDDARGWLKADGLLDVDGRFIYEMKDFTLRRDD